MKRWLVRAGTALLGILLLLAITLILVLRGSLPALDGEQPLAGLAGPVSIERDALGMVSVRAGNAEDLARATGFVHAQERYFQMDLLRRSAAGEVAALIGALAVDYDADRRRHDLRRTADAVFAALDEEEQRWLVAYAEGANAGLDALATRPFEYLLLRQSPQPWLPQDSLLVVYAMYFDLHDEDAKRERFLAALRAHFPEPFVKFLVPAGTRWDAPLMGAALSGNPLPSADVVDFRDATPAPDTQANEEVLAPGSNSWAVDAARAKHGGAIIANDMHLGLGVPNIWFRLRLVLAGDDGFDVSGASLPGLPAIIAGSNGHVAWGFTNSYGDWIDLVELETDGCENGYRTPDGCAAFERESMVIEVANGESMVRERLLARWGPIIESKSNGDTVLHALRWTAHDPAATNLGLSRMAHARSLDEAFAVAGEAGIPPQNLLVADRDGNIGWTIIGRIPLRDDHDGQHPLPSSTTGKVWQGWLAGADYPRVVNPEHGRLWTANARVAAGAALQRIGDGGYSLGARAMQIRDRLFEAEKFDERDMLRIQLDDEARFLAQWKTLLETLLDESAVAAKPDRAELVGVLKTWTGRASVDSAAYRLVDAWRDVVSSKIFNALTADVKSEFPGFGFGAFSQVEGPLWQLVTEQPAHLLPPPFESWSALMLEAADEVQATLAEQGSIAERTWGERNTTRIRHALGGLPVIGTFLNAPARALAGDNHMPRVQGRGFGASERFAVSPGREEEGYFHMPGGQSGHPLSPFYLAGHTDWEEGVPTPFLPGETRYRLNLFPGENE